MSKTSSQAKKPRRNPALIQLASQDNVNSDNSLEDLISTETRKDETPKKILTKTTPIYRAPRSDGTSSLRSSRWSLNYNAGSPSALQKLGSLKGPISLTPHGRAAQRELHFRAGLTPAGGRRKSSRNQQRETPRDDLRALSRLLTAKSQLVVPTPELSTPLNNNDGDEDESDLIRPRLSLALKPDDEDDSFLLPPESTGLEDENITVKSIELARRAINEQPYSRISRGSFGSIRLSNNVFSNINEEGMKDEIDNSSYLVNFRGDDPTLLSNIDNDLHLDDTGIFKFAIPERDRLSQIDRDSGMQQNHLVTEDNDTFFLTVPSKGNLEELENEKRLNSSYFRVEETLQKNSSVDEMNSSVQETPKILDVDSDSQNIAIQDDDLGEASPLRRKKFKLSQYGIPYPSLPVGVIKKMAITFAKTAGNRKPKINKESEPMQYMLEEKP